MVDTDKYIRAATTNRLVGSCFDSGFIFKLFFFPIWCFCHLINPQRDEQKHRTLDSTPLKPFQHKLNIRTLTEEDSLQVLTQVPPGVPNKPTTER